jgi:hypothetical protein
VHEKKQNYVRERTLDRERLEEEEEKRDTERVNEKSIRKQDKLNNVGIAWVTSKSFAYN